MIRLFLEGNSFYKTLVDAVQSVKQDAINGELGKRGKALIALNNKSGYFVCTGTNIVDASIGDITVGVVTVSNNVGTFEPSNDVLNATKDEELLKKLSNRGYKQGVLRELVFKFAEDYKNSTKSKLKFNVK